MNVGYQNLVCENICGQLVGKVCDKGCVVKYQSGDDALIRTSDFKLFSNVQIDEHLIDCVIFENADQVITLLSDIEPHTKKQLGLLDEFKLTFTEKKIFRGYLEGFTVAQLAENNFISVSTIKTHINNVFKKIPDTLKAKMMAYHEHRRRCSSKT
jgi:DNA-binding CsgD family transcriptional regulator